MTSEILAEVGREVAGSPLRMVAEVSQFVILVVIIWAVAFGFRGRRGFVANMLLERERKLREELSAAATAGDELAAATTEAEKRIATANTEAQRLLAEARADAEAGEAQVRSDADAEAARISQRAEAALANEHAQMQLELREELVDLVSQATRSIMNEKLTVAEQRKLIEGAIVSGVERASEGAPGKITPAKATGNVAAVAKAG